MRLFPVGRVILGTVTSGNEEVASCLRLFKLLPLAPPTLNWPLLIVIYVHLTRRKNLKETLEVAESHSRLKLSPVFTADFFLTHCPPPPKTWLRCHS